MKKGILIIFSFTLISLLQVSFLPTLSLSGWVPNLVLICLLAFASFASVAAGIVAALAGGFFLDLYSHLPFGFWITLSLIVFLVARHILRNYVRLPRYI